MVHCEAQGVKTLFECKFQQSDVWWCGVQHMAGSERGGATAGGKAAATSITEASGSSMPTSTTVDEMSTGVSPLQLKWMAKGEAHDRESELEASCNRQMCDAVECSTWQGF